MKIFLAAPFKNKIKNGILDESYKQLLLNLKEIINNEGYDVHLALERENWGKDFWTDEECTKKDHDEIKDSFAIIAFLDSTFSGGVHIELGWASEMKKKIIILTNKKDNLCSLIKGIKTITDCEFIEFDEYLELYNKLTEEIKKWKN